MVRARLWLCAAAVALALAGCERPTVETPQDADLPLESDVVAAVDDVTLTWGELARTVPEGGVMAWREAVQRFLFSALLAKEAQANGLVADGIDWQAFAGLAPEDDDGAAQAPDEALLSRVLERVVYKDVAVPEAELAAARERFAAESAEVRRRMEGYQTQVALGADFAKLVQTYSDVTAPLHVTRAELEASLPPELARLLLETPVGAVTDIIELSGALAMYQVVAREGDDLTLLALAQTLPEQDDGLADALLQRRREAAFWAWFEEAFRNHRVRSPLFPDLAPAQ